MTDDRRLIEDDLPIEAISAKASREKSARKGHISTLHLRWARRPLVACRAAVSIWSPGAGLSIRAGLCERRPEVIARESQRRRVRGASLQVSWRPQKTSLRLSGTSSRPTPSG
jgi:hypothetical protein